VGRKKGRRGEKEKGSKFFVDNLESGKQHSRLQTRKISPSPFLLFCFSN